MKSIHGSRKTKYRSIWISDVHLGFKGCRAEQLLKFLKSTDSKYLYLVGDIIDVWSMKKGLFWPQEHNNVIRTILGKAKKGTRVVYIPGNHDEVFREYDGLRFGNLRIAAEAVHETKQGKKILILHGDEFDGAVKCNRILNLIGSASYDFLLELNRYYNYVRRTLGFPYWSLATYIKNKVKNAIKYIQSFEEAASHEARRRDVDAVICGHIHHPSTGMLNGIQYYNTGDWVEHCTALVEDKEGEIHMIRWDHSQGEPKPDLADDDTSPIISDAA